MDKISYMVSKSSVILMLLLMNLTIHAQEFITIEHVGEEDSPIAGIIVIKGANIFSNKSGEFAKYGLSNVDYEILKWYILNKKLKKNHKCGSIKKSVGSFEIRIYEDGRFSCFILDGASDANDFFKGVIIESLKYGFNQDLIDDFRRIRNRLENLHGIAFL